MIGKVFKIVVNILLFALIAIGILVVFSFVPFPGNYKIFTVQSGSMAPAIRTGSLIFVKPMGDYNVGDVVTRRTTDPKVTITHRVFSKEEINGQIAFETKGDANNAPDSEKFTKEGIIGREFLAVPYLGYPVSFAKTSQGIILIIIIPAVIIIYDEMQKIKKEIAKKIQYRKAVKARHDNLASDKNDETQA
jgi:signal peptidase I